MADEPLVLVVDDEPGILRVISLELKLSGFDVVTAEGGQEALALMKEREPDVVLLDVLMPGMDGFETLAAIRRTHSTPVILSPATDREYFRRRGMELGANDYCPKPFTPEELAARIRAVIEQHTTLPRGQVVEADGIVFDLDRQIVTGRHGELLRFTRTEWALLKTILANAGRELPYAELLVNVWGPEYKDDVRYLQIWVARLRRKLESDPANPVIIKTRPGIGYIFEGNRVADQGAGKAG